MTSSSSTSRMRWRRCRADKRGVPLAVLCDNSRRMDTIPSRLLGLLAVRRTVSACGAGVCAGGCDRDAACHGDRRGDYEAEGAGVAARVCARWQASAQATAAERSRIRTARSCMSRRMLCRLQRRGDACQRGVAECDAVVAIASASLHVQRHAELPTARAARRAKRFGVRHFEFVEHGPFKLNGERLLLRGTHRHEDHAGVCGGDSG